MRTVELQEEFIKQLAGEITSPWDSMHIHFEYVSIDNIQHEMYVAKIEWGGAVSQFSLSLELLDVLIELNDVIPNGQSEKWSWLECHVQKSGKYAFDYKYGTPPLVSDMLT